MSPVKCKLCENNALNMLTLSEHHNGYNLIEIVESLTLIHVSSTVHADSLICKPCADCLCLVNVKVDEYRRAFGGGIKKAKQINSKTNNKKTDSLSSSKPFAQNGDVIGRQNKSLDISRSKTTPKSADKKKSQSLIFPKEAVKPQKPKVAAKSNHIGSVDCNSDSEADAQNVSRLSLDDYRTSTRLEEDLILKTSSKKPKPEIQRRKSIYHFTCEYCGFETTTIKGFQTHLVEEHDIKQPRVFECKPCGLKYTVKCNLDLHNKKRHAKENDEQAIVNNNKAEPKVSKKTEVHAEPVNLIELSKKTIRKGTTSRNEPSHVAGIDVDALAEQHQEATTVNDKSNEQASRKEKSKNEKNCGHDGAKTTVAVSKLKGAKKSRNTNNFHFSCDHCPFESSVCKTFSSHLTDAHGVVKPRIYKCEQCNNSYYRNQGLQKHIKTVHYQQKEEASFNFTKDGDDDKNDDDGDDDKNDNDDDDEKNEDDNDDQNDNDDDDDDKDDVDDDDDDVNNDISHGEVDSFNKHSTAQAYDTFSHASSVVAKIKPLDVLVNKESIRSVFQFKCSNCEFATNQANAFRKHLSEVHGIDDNYIFACNQCSMRYLHKKNLNRHMNLKHGIKTEGITDPKALKEEEYEEKSLEKPNLKTVPSKTLKRKSEPDTKLETFATPPPPAKQRKRASMNLTVNKSALETTSTSTSSPPSSPTNDYSMAHSLDVSFPLIKTESERLTCSKCMKHFKSKEKLESHMSKRHRKQPLPSCHSCNKTFTTQEAFAKHRSCASCVKDLYRCEVANCQKSFSDKVFLLKHINNKHPNKSYQFEGYSE